LIEVITATRLSEPDFRAQSWLARSLRQVAPGIPVRAACDNTRGLPEVYNEAIEAADPGATLVFAHDDVWILDRDFARSLARALGTYEVVGVVGNARRAPGQTAWVSADGERPDVQNLRGRIAHPHGALGRDFADTVFQTEEYGLTPARVRILDGVLLAARAQTFRSTGVRLDPQFQFHLYDLDLCRALDASGVTMGVWPIDLAHASRGDLTEWRGAREAYLQKWSS